MPLKEISAYLALLEGGTPEDKLECKLACNPTKYKQSNCISVMFRMYDTDKNGYLDQVNCILESAVSLVHNVLSPDGDGQFSVQCSVSRWKLTVYCTVSCLQVEIDSILYSVLSPGGDRQYGVQCTVSR